MPARAWSSPHRRWWEEEGRWRRHLHSGHTRPCLQCWWSGEEPPQRGPWQRGDNSLELLSGAWNSNGMLHKETKTLSEHVILIEKNACKKILKSFLKTISIKMHQHPFSWEPWHQTLLIATMLRDNGFYPWFCITLFINIYQQNKKMTT